MRHLVILSVAAVLTGCGSTPSDTYERRAQEQRLRQERQVERAIDKAPKWMTQAPISADAVYATGSAVSSDLSMADYKSKLIAFGKICVAAGGTVNQQGRIFIQDQNDVSFETSEMAIKTMCPAVDITGVEIKEIKRMAEGSRYRTYVLVALPMNQANGLRQRKERQQLENRAQKRADEAFRELDEIGKSRQ